MNNNKVSFKNFLVNYDKNQDEYIQYRRRKFRRTDTTSESVRIDEISKDKLYTYYKKSYDDETERRGDAIAQKRNLTPAEKRKNANRKAYRKKAASLIAPKPKKVSDAGKSGQRPDGSDERMKFRKAFKKAQNESTESVEEALSISQRRQKAIQMKKMKGKIKIGQERARRRVASNEKLLNRARKHARMTLFKKLSKGKGKSDIDYARREAIEKRLDKMKGKIDMLAKKLLPSIRKAELSKRQKKNG